MFVVVELRISHISDLTSSVAPDFESFMARGSAVVNHRQVQIVFSGAFNSCGISGIGVAHYPCSRVIPEYPPQAQGIQPGS